jgi:hypothetical protein
MSHRRHQLSVIVCLKPAIAVNLFYKNNEYTDTLVKFSNFFLEVEWVNEISGNTSNEQSNFEPGFNFSYLC